jgi:hypothetical protein
METKALLSLPLHKFILILGRHAARDQMLLLAAQLCLQQKITVIDGGNHFNVYQVARHIRRKTPRLNEMLCRIQVARSFSCYQMAAMLAVADPQGKATLVFDLLAAFYDETVRLEESRRLLKRVLKDLARLSRVSPVIVSAHPPRAIPERGVLLGDLQTAAGGIWESEIDESLLIVKPGALRLFEDES